MAGAWVNASQGNKDVLTLLVKALTGLAHVPWALDGRIQPPDQLAAVVVNEYRRFVSESVNIKFSLLTPLWNTRAEWLKELIYSCQAQSYPYWELILIDDASIHREHLSLASEAVQSDPRITLTEKITNEGISEGRNSAIKAATGTHLAILDHDDLLHPQILGIFARYMALNPAVNFLYCNEAKVDADSRLASDFFSKCDFSYATLLRTNYIAHFAACARSLLTELQQGGEPCFRREFDGAEDHDYFLRLASLPNFRPGHLPIFGYLWRKSPTSTAASLSAKPQAVARANYLVKSHLSKIAHTEPVVIDAGERGLNKFHSLEFRLAKRREVLVVVPFKDKIELTLKCLNSLKSQRGSLALRVILVDNGSEQNAVTRDLRPRLSLFQNGQIELVRDNGPFNYARLNNRAIREFGEGVDYIFLLNNDVELTSPHAIEQLVATQELDATLAVSGMKLWYPKRGGIQHGGITMFPEVRGSGYFRIGHANAENEFVHDEHAAIAVSFAAALLRMSAYQAVGPLEESYFPNGFGDVEWCLRARRAGFRCFYHGTLEGVHHESATRGSAVEDFELAMLNHLYAPELNDMRLLSMGYDRHANWNQSASATWIDRPLRYKVADEINDVLKKRLGAIHRRFKRSIQTKQL